ncbi:hypothetical protein K7432_009537 [Basidiobolus ranarum]|uniref:Uncharacterized protein n=1 Tax=Basidiobolus ranarum TaxID=34480 RepID=A0ABR2VXU3_9FUNG
MQDSRFDIFSGVASEEFGTALGHAAESSGRNNIDSHSVEQTSQLESLSTEEKPIKQGLVEEPESTMMKTASYHQKNNITISDIADDQYPPYLTLGRIKDFFKNH